MSRIAFVAAQTEIAIAARLRLTALYGDTRPEDADVIVALGGDGLMLEVSTPSIRMRPEVG